MYKAPWMAIFISVLCLSLIFVEPVDSDEGHSHGEHGHSHDHSSCSDPGHSHDHHGHSHEHGQSDEL